MFEELSNKFEAVFNKIRGRGRLTEENIADAVRDVKRALLEADVNYRVVKKFSQAVQEKAVGAEVLQSITPGQQFIKLVHSELTGLLGGTARQPREPRFHTNRTNVVVVAGLQGSGKTTACAKLALFYRKQGHRPLLVACDVYRAAAIDQLETLGKALAIPVFADRGAKPVDIVKSALEFAKRDGHTLVCVDTAGRLHIDAGMMAELAAISAAAKPDEIFLLPMP